MQSYLLSTLLLMLPVLTRTEITHGYDCPSDQLGIQGVGSNPKQIKVAFLVHNAGNIPEQNLQLMVYILSNINKYYIDQYYSSNFIRGICLFSGKAEWKIQMDYEHIDDKTDLTSHINLNVKSNGTRIDDGFHAVEDELNLFANTSANAPNVCILLTTSPPDNMASATAAAENLKNSGVNIVVITVGGDVDKGDVEVLATRTKLVFTAKTKLPNTDQDLRLIADNVTGLFRSVWTHAQVLPKYTWCYEAAISIVIIIDISGNHTEALKQLWNFLSEFNYVYTSLKIMVINSQKHDDRFPNLLKWLKNAFIDVVFEILDNTSDLLFCFGRARQYQLRFQNQKEQIIIVATDKSVKNINDIIEESHLCQKIGIHIMALGVGAEVPKDQLSRIITDPTGIATVKSFDDFAFGLRKLYRNLCPVGCHKGWTYHEGMCFNYQPKAESWDVANDLCRKVRATLVSITSPEKYAWLKSEFLVRHNRPTNIGLRKNTIRKKWNRFTWRNRKPLVFSDWSREKTPPEPNGAGYEECVAWYQEGWKDVVCRMVLNATYICEMEANNATKQDQKGVKVLPLWNELVCQVPESGFDKQGFPILFTGNQCRPLFNASRMPRELDNIFNCSNGELISQLLLCDGESHCQDGSDEKNCATNCTEDQFHCSNSHCISLAYICDFWDDCGDNSDEENCVILPCEPYVSWQCRSGQCIPIEKRCDLYKDCYDESDEAFCYDKCEHMTCHDGTCIPSHWVMDGEVDCDGGRYEDEVVNGTGGKHNCYKGTFREIAQLFTNTKYTMERPNCTMVFDGFGKHFQSFDTNGHACSDDDILCPIGFYRCPSSYCIPIERVCNHELDCINGEDEVECGNFECPGYYRCPGTNYCLHPSRICDGDGDCPGGKDEVMCDVKCPNSCICFAGIVKCHNIFIGDPKPFDHRTRKIVVSDSDIETPESVFREIFFVREIILNGVQLSSLKDIFLDPINLIKLNISNNTINTIAASSLSSLRKLQILDLSYNPLTNISINSFTGLSNLQELYMKYTSIEVLEQDTFSALVNLRVLDLTGKLLKVIKDQAFSGLGRLSVLYMQGNIITTYSEQVFEGLKTLEEFHTDVYKLCCPQVRPESLVNSKCVSPKSPISSCSDLLANDFLRSSIWVLCIASLFGNLMSTVVRFVWERDSMKNGFGVFVTHLGIADFLMGVYLLIIAVADTLYKGTYILQESIWQQSHYCKLAGTLSVLSSEASTFFICLITLDRFLIIKFPFGQLKFRYKTATITAILAWLLAFIIAIVPLFPSLSHWKFYNKNGACLAFPFSTKKTPGWTYSVAIFTGLNFVAFIIIALGQLSIYRTMKQASLITSKERRAQEIAVAHRLLLIVATDFLCWFPTGILSVLALNGVSLNGTVYAWIAVFVLPVNSALNPFLYTIPAFKQKMDYTGRRAKTALVRMDTFPKLSLVYVRNGEKTTVQRCVTVHSEVQPRVRIADPDPGQVLLEDALKQLKTKQEKIQLMRDIWGGVIDCLVTHSSVQPLPNAIYLSMRGKFVHSVNLAVRNDTSSTDFISAVMTLVNTQPDVEQKTDLDNDS